MSSRPTAAIHVARGQAASTRWQPPRPDVLVISVVTVKSHVGNIFHKLGVRDRAAAVVYAFDHGVVSPRAR